MKVTSPENDEALARHIFRIRIRRAFEQDRDIENAIDLIEDVVKDSYYVKDYLHGMVAKTQVADNREAKTDQEAGPAVLSARQTEPNGR